MELLLKSSCEINLLNKEGRRAIQLSRDPEITQILREAEFSYVEEDQIVEEEEEDKEEEGSDFEEENEKEED